MLQPYRVEGSQANLSFSQTLCVRVMKTDYKIREEKGRGAGRQGGRPAEWGKKGRRIRRKCDRVYDEMQTGVRTIQSFARQSPRSQVCGIVSVLWKVEES